MNKKGFGINIVYGQSKCFVIVCAALYNWIIFHLPNFIFGFAINYWMD